MANENNGKGIGVVGVLGLIFIVLKLCKVIDWSWWWVLSPFWISFVIGLVLLLIIVICDQ